MDVPRRSLLHSSALALSLGVAGCNGLSARTPETESPTETDSSTPTTTASSTPTETPAPTTLPPSSPALDFSATVLHQSSVEAPTRLEATLTNTGSTTATVGFGPALLFTDSGPEVDWAEDVVLDPETDVGPSDYEPERDDSGCWRSPRNGRIMIESSLESRELGPEGSLSEQYDLYTRGNSLPCLPEGTYRFEDELQTESDTWILSLIVEIDRDHEVSVSTGEIVPLPE